MQLIKEFDYKDYKSDGTVGVRPSVRGIIIKGDKLALVYVEEYDYYTFPGGGVEVCESLEEAVIREVREELGLKVIPESIREYGKIIRKEKGHIDDCFVQENNTFLCDVYDGVFEQELDYYEKQEKYKLAWVTPKEAIETNLYHDHSNQKDSEFCAHLIEREVWLLNRLVSEGRFR